MPSTSKTKLTRRCFLRQAIVISGGLAFGASATACGKKGNLKAPENSRYEDYPGAYPKGAKTKK